MMHGFDLLRDEQIAELNTRARLWKHQKTGAELLSLENDDENKVFGINFRTPPPDNTGLPHILEHSVLCGSRKYPTKEPFVELIKGSLNTFINAITYPDKTCYPVASQNLQDFYNLVDVYLDAVFYPRLTPYVLQQEGWHYELDDINGPLTYKGVVFNEMKGAYSSPDGVLYEQAQQTLFPDNIYGVDSGGNPRYIPDLTFEQFQKFHQTYYHPSNARIFFYGDDDPTERLRLLDEYLKDYEHLTVASGITVQSPFEAPRQHHATYAADAEADQKAYATVGWGLPVITDVELKMGLGMLSYVLVGTSAAPLRKALIDSGLGEDITGAGLARQLHQMYFSTGLKGVAAEDAGRVETLILETLQALATDGIAAETIEAALNTVEFNLRENNTGSFPRGIALMLSALTTWLYDGDPLAPLAFETPLQAIKGRIANGERYFEGLIQTYLLDNTHRVTLTLTPDPAQQQRQEADERARLDAAFNAMSKDERQAVLENTQTLRELQETPDSPEALATIPTLAVDDLDRENKVTPLEVQEEAGTTILYHDLFTNGIAYVEWAFNLHRLPARLLPYLPLFGDALRRIGTETEDFVKLSQRIGSKTGGVRVTDFASARHHDPQQATAWLIIRGKALMHQLDDLFAIVRDMLLTVKLDNQARFRQMVLEDKAHQESYLIPRGHGVVATRLRSFFNEADWADEQLDGLSYLFFLRELAQKVDEDWPSVLAALEEIRQYLISREGMVCNVTLDGDNWTHLRPRLVDFLGQMPNTSITPAAWSPDLTPRAEGWTLPAQVNYVGKGMNLYDLGYERHGSISVLTNYIRTTWLWERIRMQGGAYGAFCSFDRQSGVFSYGSYRDPNLLKTLENYDLTSQFLRNPDLTQADVSKAIIGAIGKLDAYQLPDAKGYSSMIRYLIGVSDADHQRYREEILATTPAHFHAFAEVLEQFNQRATVVVLGSPDAITAANADNWLAVQKAL